MSKKFRILLLCLAAFALIVFVAVRGLFTGGAERSATIPNPNGYDDFVQAGALAPDDASDAATFETNQLREFVRTNAEPLRLVRLGLTRRCSFPTDSAITNFSATFGGLGRFRRVAWLLVAEGRLAELEDRLSDAARSYLD